MFEYFLAAEEAKKTGMNRLHDLGVFAFTASSPGGRHSSPLHVGGVGSPGTLGEGGLLEEPKMPSPNEGVAVVRTRGTQAACCTPVPSSLCTGR
jgi:hypothetical protein